MPTIYKNKVQYSGSSIGGVETVAGIIQMYGGSTAPDGYLLCDGSAVSRSTYPSLFAAIGTTYGSGDGSTTFNVPDLRGAFPVGSDSVIDVGDTGGEKTVVLTKDQLPEHQHTFYADFTSRSTNYQSSDFIWPGQNMTGSTNSYTADGLNQYNAASYTKTYKISGNTGTGDVSENAHNNMPPYTAVNYIISVGRMDSSFSNLMYSEQHGYSGGIQDKYLLTPDTVAELEDAGLVTESGSSGKIDQAIGSMTGTVLFDNDQNNSETIQLLDSAINYDRMEIYYKSNDNGWDHTSVIHPDGKDISLISNTPRSNANYFKAVIYHINGNSISISSNYYAQLSFTSTSHTFQNSVNIYITQVLGYKYA